ncbi:MAG TPA: hypothetical protein VH187_05335 [Scandinavium sp.]|jgi:hypothetical protein|uniref:hypothetical protein n=1 Tax=Scandinavium sp. TaxID=2830653 RepID=UPI002E35EEBC|nr:hypothetical protein [Scandinavium sp.]HEX4500583.1 hypothetical protein [Scandinavium sp.]
MNASLDDVEIIAEELAPSLCGKTIQELRRELLCCPTSSEDMKRLAGMLHDLFKAASVERYKRMGKRVVEGNVTMRMREPGEDDSE